MGRRPAWAVFARAEREEAPALESQERVWTAGRRRAALAVALCACGVLALFPRLFTARVKLMPPQSSNAGLGALLSQLGGLASFAPLLNNRQPAEVYLVLARSNDVALEVVKKLSLERRLGVGSPERAVKKLRKWVDIHVLRGGVLEMEVEGTDAKLAVEIAGAYATAFQDRLAGLAREEVEHKRAVMNEQLMRATTRLTDAEAALTKYRTVHRVASPEAQLGSSVSLLAMLRARLQAKEVELSTVRQFATEQSYEVQRVQSEITGLRKEIDKAESATAEKDPFGFQSFTKESSEYLSLYRDLKYAEALYEVYARYLEAVNVEEVSASINAQVVESPYLVPELALHLWAVGLGALVLALAAFLEQRARELHPRE